MQITIIIRSFSIFNNFRVVIIAFLILLIAEILPAAADNSLRTDLNLNLTIDKRFLIKSYMFHQLNKDVSDYNYLETGTGLQYQTPVQWLSLLVYYQESYSKDFDGRWDNETKPSININTTNTLSAVKITNQIRYEYRFTPEWSDYRIKNYLVLCLYEIFLQPYTGWEMFYEGHNGNFMLHRIKFGIGEKIYSVIKAGIYYRFDISNIDNEWKFTRNLAGIQMTLNY